MEDLLKQVRSKVSGKEEFGSSRGRKTPSFKGERGPQKWLKRQLSRQMSYKEPREDAEYAAAVAAAAFAITSLDSDVPEQRKPDFEPQFSLPRVISGMVDRIAAAAAAPGPGEESERLPDEYQTEAKETIPEKTIHPVPSSRRTPSMPKKRLTFADEMQENFGDEMQEHFSTPYNYPEDAPNFHKEEFEEPKRIKPTNSFTRRTPSMRRTPSYGENQLPNAKTPKESSAPRHFTPAPIPPPPAVPPLNIQPRTPTKQERRPTHRRTDTDADEWERREIAKIKERYDKLNATISDWEYKKKTKAKRKLDTTENELERRRTKALHNYQIEIDRIRQIADGARAQAKEKRRNEEFKVKEKANKYRATGEPPMPPVCRCL